MCVHQMRRSRSLVAGQEDSAIPRRLVDLCAIPASGRPGHSLPSLSRGRVGSQGELGEEPLSDHNLHQCNSGHSHYEGLASTVIPPTEVDGRLPLGRQVAQTQKARGVRTVPYHSCHGGGSHT